MTTLTQTQFTAAQDKLDNLARSSRKGSADDKAAFASASAEWEAAIALPQATAAQRETRLALIAGVASKFGLVS
jgi:hypothetical protein